MFDISWTEFLLIGVVALVVIGPKELPGVLRTLGQYTRKVRSMAADFQNQFQEAMREAEMADLKKQVDDMAKDIKEFDPLKGVREDLESAGKDIQRSLEEKPEDKAALPSAEPGATEAPPPSEPAALEAPSATEAAAPVAPVERSELETVSADAPAAAVAPTDEAAAAPSTGPKA